jgi:hypothetical protein
VLNFLKKKSGDNFSMAQKIYFLNREGNAVPGAERKIIFERSKKIIF